MQRKPKTPWRESMESLLLAPGPNWGCYSWTGSDSVPDGCNAFPHKSCTSHVNISCCNPVLEFLLYYDIIYIWNMQIDVLFLLPFSEVQSDQLLRGRNRNPVIILWPFSLIWQRLNEYWSECKSDNGRWSMASICTVHIFIMLQYNQHSYTWWKPRV